ncbi:MAG TPA: hypothetical protein VGH34_11380 [Vicinamibacterales bacterium]
MEAEAAFSTRVVHRYRLGNCRGVLSVSRQGIEYVPEGTDRKDAFRFAYGQFVHGVDGDGLTIKTNDRTFRFEPVTVNGVRDGKDLAAMGASLDARRRRGFSLATIDGSGVADAMGMFYRCCACPSRSAKWRHPCVT